MFVQKSDEPAVLDDSVAKQVVEAAIPRWIAESDDLEEVKDVTVYISPNPGKPMPTASPSGPRRS